MTPGDGNESVSYTWDNLNRLITVVDSKLGTTTYTCDNASNVVTVTYPNGVKSTLGEGWGTLFGGKVRVSRPPASNHPGQCSG